MKKTKRTSKHSRWLHPVTKAQRLIARWRREAEKKGRRPMSTVDSWTCGVLAGEQHAFNRCAKELEAALNGKP